MKNNIIVERIKAKKIKKGDKLWNIEDFEEVESVAQYETEPQNTLIFWYDRLGDVVPNDSIYLRLKK